MDLDARVRMAALNFFTAQTRLLGEVLPRTLLPKGFPFESQRVRLIGPQGIFKPAALPELPLTITTVPTVEGQAPLGKLKNEPTDISSYTHLQSRGYDRSMPELCD